VTHIPTVASGETVAVIGLGLIGGSIARDLAGRGVRIIAYDRDENAVQSACVAGVVREALATGLQQAVDADVIVVATPVDEAHGVLRALARLQLRARLVLDVGSTKSAVVATAAAEGLEAIFVGSHPLAGGHQSGWEASRAGLFQGARVFVCPGAGSPAGTVAAAIAFWESLGAVTECLDASAHDERIAWSSHLPQVVSTALALTLQGAGVRRSELGPGGRDVTRLAGSSAEVWAPIVRENATAVAAALAAAEEELRVLRRLLLTADAGLLAARLTEAREWFEVAGPGATATPGAAG